MKQNPFIKKYAPLWDQFDDWLNYQQLSRKERKTLEAPDIDVPAYYRQICHHLALSRSRLYSHVLIERLHQLVLNGHQVLYKKNPYVLHHIGAYFAGDFAALIRQEWRLVLLSALLAFMPFLAALITIQYAPDMVYTVLDHDSIQKMEAMYDPTLHEKLGREREADSDLRMFGYYIKHNIGIDFQIFSSGMLFGLGSIFFLLFNGLYLGAVAGHLTYIGSIDTFWGFVVGHSSFELIAMVFAGAAGFKLAEALIRPKQKTRAKALIDNGLIAVKIMYGTAIMTLIAAFIEAFWSSIVWMPLAIKYTVGVALWVLVISYFVFMGRGRHEA